MPHYLGCENYINKLLISIYHFLKLKFSESIFFYKAEVNSFIKKITPLFLVILSRSKSNEINNDF